LNVCENISPLVRGLLENYGFNKETLANSLSVSVECINDLAQGKINKLPADFTERGRIIDKIIFLAIIPEEAPDLKVKAFLEVLLTYHNLSKETIAKMAGIEISDIDIFLSNECEKMGAEIKYKIASVTMALRFFLKDNEP
jgi:predicted XRE-type DNA-binding protein